jgi:predicted AAA+ superfamily ATPase
MERAVQKELLAWKNRPNRLPLILQGARQVGKTFCMKWLGANHYKGCLYFNFDERPELKEIFDPQIRIRYSLKNLQYRDGFLNIPLFLSDYTREFLAFVKV